MFAMCRWEFNIGLRKENCEKPTGPKLIFLFIYCRYPKPKFRNLPQCYKPSIPYVITSKNVGFMYLPVWRTDWECEPRAYGCFLFMFPSQHLVLALLFI